MKKDPSTSWVPTGLEGFMSEREESVANGEMSSGLEGRGASEIDLNAASEEELCQLPGIGPALAARVVNYRSEVHPFEEPAEIVAVPGITEAMYEGMVDRLTIGTSAVVEVVEPTDVEREAEIDAEELDIATEEAPESDTVEVVDSPEGERETEFDLEELEIAAEEAPESDTVEVVDSPDAEGEAEFDVEEAYVPEADDLELQEDLMPETEPSESGRLAGPDEGPPIVAYTTPPQGGHWGRLLVFSLLGAVVGAILALAFLLMVNGTLNFEMASSKALSSEASRIDGEISGLALELSELRGRVDVLQDLAMRLEEAQTDLSKLSRGLGVVESEVEGLIGDMTRVQAELRTLSGEMGRTDENVTTLQAEAGAMQAQLKAVSDELDVLQQDTRRFGGFLGGLRDLLDQSVAPQSEATAVWPVRSTATPRPTSQPTSQPAITVIPLATPAP
jgi:hypothetical protein